MHRRLVVMVCGIAFCTGAYAQPRPLEARNPFHCGIALQVTHDLVKKAHGADSLLAEDLQDRVLWQSFAAARFPKPLGSDVEGDALRRQLIEDPQATVALAEACMIRQDAHPQFREARLEKQLRDGLPTIGESDRASIEALKGFLGKMDTPGRASD